MNEFDIVFHRIQSQTDIQTITQLSKVVECTSQNVSTKKSKGVFSVDWAYKIGQKYNLLTEWIMKGTGQMKPGTQITEEEKILCEIKEWLNEISKEDERKKIWFEIQFEDKFPEFKEWAKKRNSDSEYTIPQKKTA